MSVFRPINSDESNLFHIRCLVSFKESSYQFGASTNTPANVNIAGGLVTESDTTTTFTNLMKSPTPNNLPPNFGIYVDNTNKIFYCNYGKEFVKSPNIHVTPLISFLDDTDNEIDRLTTGIVIPQISENTNTHYESITNFETLSANSINTGRFNFLFKFYNILGGSNDFSLADYTKFNGFCLDIIGPVKLGATTGNSNRGWGVGTGNDPGSIYSHMNIGIGTGNPKQLLTIRGNLDAPFKFSSKSSTGNITTDTTLVATRGNIACMYDDIIVVNAASNITLTLRNAQQVANDLIEQFRFEPKTGISFDLTVVNSSSNTVTIATPTNITTNPTSSHTTIGNMVINGNSTGVFKIYFTDITLNLTSGSFVYQLIRVN